MMHLPPASIDEKSESCERSKFLRLAISVCATFPTHGPKYIASAMNGIIPKLNVDICRTPEDCLIHLMRLIRAAPNSSERVVNRDLVGVRKIFVDHLQIESIE